MPFVPGSGTAYPTALTEVGLAIETSKGTLAAAPAYMFPVKAPKYKPNQTYIVDDSLQGSMNKVYDEVPGMRYDSHGWDAFPYLDSFPILACAQLGSTDTLVTAPTSTTLSTSATAGASSISTVGTIAAGSVIVIGSGTLQETHITSSVTGAGPYTIGLSYPLVNAQGSGVAVTGLTGHKFSLLNSGTGQPPSVSLWDYDGEEWRTMAGCQMGDLTIKGNATGLVDYSCTWDGNPAVQNASQPSVSYTTTRTPPPWTFQCLIGGSQIQTVEEWEVSMKRNTTPIPALTGTPEYLLYLANVLEITAKLTFVEQSGSPYLASYLNGASESVDLTIFDQQTGDLLNLHSTSSRFTMGELDRGKEYVTVPIDIQPLPTTTDATAGGKSPILITVGNAVSSAYH